MTCTRARPGPASGTNTTAVVSTPRGSAFAEPHHPHARLFMTPTADRPGAPNLHMFAQGAD